MWTNVPSLQSETMTLASGLPLCKYVIACLEYYIPSCTLHQVFYIVYGPIGPAQTVAMRRFLGPHLLPNCQSASVCRVTNQLCMWYWEQDRTSVTCTDSSHDALVLLFNTFCTKPPLDLEEIKRRNAEKEAWIKRRVDQFKREHQNKCKLKRERQGMA